MPASTRLLMMEPEHRRMIDLSLHRMIEWQNSPDSAKRARHDGDPQTLNQGTVPSLR